jgi:CubicO group peptidase (beta-lactamase class C family)
VTTLSATGLSALHDRIHHELDAGMISAAQVAIGIDGKVQHFEAFGAATTEQRFVIFSATKTLVAMALLPHFADGTLDLTTPVAHYLPEFGHHGKDDVTVLQLLTMQGGFPQAPIDARPLGHQRGPARRLRRVAAGRGRPARRRSTTRSPRTG